MADRDAPPSAPPSARTVYRYAVVEVGGDVPINISQMVGDPDAFLLYDDDQGPEIDQSFVRRGRTVGWWVCEARGVVGVSEDGTRTVEIADV